MIACRVKVLSKRNEVTAELRNEIEHFGSHRLQLLHQCLLRLHLVHHVLTLYWLAILTCYELASDKLTVVVIDDRLVVRMRLMLNLWLRCLFGTSLIISRVYTAAFFPTFN